jgi:hypothetical protein
MSKSKWASRFFKDMLQGWKRRSISPRGQKPLETRNRRSTTQTLSKYGLKFVS